VGGCFRKGLAFAQLTVKNKIGGFINLSYNLKKEKIITHRKLNNHCAKQILRRLACAVPGSGVS
jgi:hypothetical protein